MIKKRIISIVMVIVLVFTLFPLNALAVEPSLNLTYYDAVSNPSDGMARINTNSKYGFIDCATGKQVIDLIYDYADDFHEGLAAVSTGGTWDEYYGYKEGKWGFIDKAGKIVVPLIYDKVCDFSEGYAAVVTNNKAGFINKAGDMVIAQNYFLYMQETTKFSEGMAVVQSGGTWEEPNFIVINNNGSKLLDLNYGYVYGSSFSGGMLAVAEKGELGIGGGYIDKWGNCLVERSVLYGTKFGFVDTSGKEIVPVIYDDVWDFSDEIAVVKKDNKFGAVDNTGKVIIPVTYDDINVKAFEGFIGVKSNGLWGYVDYANRVVIPATYSIASNFSEGIVTVAKNGLWGAIDKTGSIVIPFKYNNLWNFSEGLVRVRVENGGKWGFLDKSGNMVIEPTYQAASDFVNGTAIVEKDSKFGVIKMVETTSVGINKTTDNLATEGTDTLTSTIAPSNATNKNVTWAVTSGSNVISVSLTGLVTALTPGTATVRATSNSDSTKYAECIVKVFPKKDVNKDGEVNISDITEYTRFFNTKRDDIEWNGDYDMNYDGVIDIFDIVKISKSFTN